MAILPVLTIPNLRLRIRANLVECVDGEIRQLMADMVETMYANHGMGLAATQVDVSKRVLIMDMGILENKRKPLKIANPEIIWKSEEMQVEEEGCLSVPKFYAKVARHTEVKFTYVDENNTPQQRHVSGPFAACIQHEIDHLNGKLFIDYLSRARREMILHKFKKQKNKITAAV